MNRLGLIRFTPHYRTVRWGGQHIAQFKNIHLEDTHVGESWEISSLEGMETVIAEGPLSGMTITDLLRNHGEEILGKKLHERFGEKFPLLIKFIDAEDDLSIQVHPDDKLSNGCGKTELWYIIDAQPGAHIYSGFNQKLTHGEMTRILNERTITNVLAKHYAQAGDVFYLPAGRVHSIGAGNFVLEIQQPSDITYRLWDYDRRDANGNLRPLHIDSALQAVDYTQTDFGLARPQLLDNRETVIKRTPFFTVTALCVEEAVKLEVSANQSFRVLMVVEGSGTIEDSNGNTAIISRGHTVLVPASTEWVEIRATDRPMRVITAYIEPIMLS